MAIYLIHSHPHPARSDPPQETLRATPFLGPGAPRL